MVMERNGRGDVLARALLAGRLPCFCGFLASSMAQGAATHDRTMEAPHPGLHIDLREGNPCFCLPARNGGVNRVKRDKVNGDGVWAMR